MIASRKEKESIDGSAGSYVDVTRQLQQMIDDTFGQSLALHAATFDANSAFGNPAPVKCS
jgi:hypothetical protein